MITNAIEKILPLFLALSNEQKKKIIIVICEEQKEIFELLAAKYQLDIDAYSLFLTALKKEEIIENYQTKIIALAPDLDDYSGEIAASSAIDACGVLFEAFAFFEDGEAEHFETILHSLLNVPQMYDEENSHSHIFVHEVEKIKTWLSISAQNFELLANPTKFLDILKMTIA